MQWLTENEAVLWWLAASSVVIFFATLLVIPWLIVRIPADYFVRHERRPSQFRDRHPLIMTLGTIARNMLALLLISVGILLLFLPGQGLLTIFVGMLVGSYPGRQRLLTWLVVRPSILRPLNWIRRKAGRAPLQIPELP